MYSFTAKVIAGKGRGGRIGFPTANLDKLNLAIDYGVYLVKVKSDGKIYQGLMHFGPKKTFNQEVSCEIFIKDFKNNIYGQRLEVEVVRKIREVRKFADAEELKKQIKKDLHALGN